jgi:hypothetical protein
MTDRFARIAVFSLVTLAFLTPAQGGLISSVVEGAKQFGVSVARDYKRRNCWPEPFAQPERYDVRSPFGIMVYNGWRQENLLGDYHFVDEGGELTEAARIKVRWILTQVPLQHRTIYVQTAINPDVTALRIDNVQQLASQIVPEGPLPPVVETMISPRGWRAAEADLIGRKFEASAPEPRLPDADATQTQ